MAKIQQGDKWYYHPIHGAELGWADEAQPRYKAGWCDTPDHFPPPMPKDFSFMSKEEILDYAKEKYNVELDKRKNRDNLLKAVEALGG